MATKCHPDKYPNDVVKLQQFLDLKFAQDILLNADTRKKYDDYLRNRELVNKRAKK